MIVVDQGLQWLMERLIAIWDGAPVLDNLNLHLYNNAYNLIYGSTQANVNDAAADGASAQLMNNFSVPVITAGHQAFTVEVPHVFTANGAGTNIFGWYVTETAGGLLIWGHSYGGPVPFNVAGLTITVTPSFLLQSIALN